jgi:hypothetical protein
VISGGTDICDALTLALKIAERVELLNGSVADVRRELEVAWLDIAYADEQIQEETHGCDYGTIGG